MSTGSTDIRVAFKVTGAELLTYVDQIQKKSDQLTNSAISGAQKQAEAGKAQLKIISDTISALERKSRIEGQGMRSLLSDRKQQEIIYNREDYAGRKNTIYADRSMSESQKKEKIISLEGAEKANEERIKNDYKENLQAVRETERQAKIQTQLAKENISTLRETALSNVKAISQGDLKLADVFSDAKTEEQKLVANLTSESLREEKNNQQKESLGGDNRNRGFLPSLLALDDINRGISAIGKVVNSKTGFELISPVTEISGQLLGAAVGAIFNNAALGASMGGAAGKAVGDRMAMNANAKEDFFKANNRYRAVTGGDLTGLINLENIGVSANQNINLQSEYARRRGYASGSGTTTRDALYAERGLGVDQAVSQGLIEIQRSGNKDLAGLIGGILQKGSGTMFKNGDTTFLNEFLGKFVQMQKELLRTNSSVATGTTMGAMSAFNSLGGEFDMRDPRSMGLISGINSSLSNPNTDMKKALSFYALRRGNPGMGQADLMEAQQQGLANPTYLKSMMDLVSGMGGSEDSKRLNFAGLLGLEGNQKFATDVYRGYRAGKFRNGFGREDLNNINIGDLKSRAEENTNEIERQSAQGDDRLLSKVFSDESIKQIVDGFKTAVGVSLSGAVIELNDGKGTITFTGAALQNKTRTAASK